MNNISQPNVRTKIKKKIFAQNAIVMYDILFRIKNIFRVFRENKIRELADIAETREAKKNTLHATSISLHIERLLQMTTLVGGILFAGM